MFDNFSRNLKQVFRIEVVDNAQVKEAREGASNWVHDGDNFGINIRGFLTSNDVESLVRFICNLFNQRFE